jgi:GMP synthase-like glutamine amidotransferase
VTQLRALVVVHEPGNSPGLVGRRLEYHGYELVETLVTDDLASPSGRFDGGEASDHDLIVVMGSMYSVYDTSTIGEWIDDELGFLAAAQRAAVPVLGICFGAQALATSLGGAVTRAERPQIGWHPLRPDPASGLPAGPWMQWHYDHFEPPPDADVIARDDVCVQAFTIGRSLGVQFHPEVTVSNVEVWIEAGGADELIAAGIDPAALIAETAEMQGGVVDRTNRLVDWFLADVASRSPAAWPGTLPATRQR